ncbi:unnamed protein product [Meloidogyne enterolobii]|uniref:Uncharacterized protein n=1 Tax=Meloidogyne enterolobii TaxID=390850 RepID=A0ACB0XTM8_MELEN
MTIVTTMETLLVGTLKLNLNFLLREKKKKWEREIQINTNFVTKKVSVYSPPPPKWEKRNFDL